MTCRFAAGNNPKTLGLVGLISYKLKTEVIGSLEKTSVKNECCEGQAELQRLPDSDKGIEAE